MLPYPFQIFKSILNTMTLKGVPITDGGWCSWTGGFIFESDMKMQIVLSSYMIIFRFRCKPESPLKGKQIHGKKRWKLNKYQKNVKIISWNVRGVVRKWVYSQVKDLIFWIYYGYSCFMNLELNQVKQLREHMCRTS